MGMQVPAAKAWEFGARTNAAVAPVSSSPSSTAAQKRTALTAEGTAVSYSPTKRYFVEFRARNAASYGHLYVMYGEANEHHEAIRALGSYCPRLEIRRRRRISKRNSEARPYTRVFTAVIPLVYLGRDIHL